MFMFIWNEVLADIRWNKLIRRMIYSVVDQFLSLSFDYIQFFIESTTFHRIINFVSTQSVNFVSVRSHCEDWVTPNLEMKKKCKIKLKIDLLNINSIKMARKVVSISVYSSFHMEWIHSTHSLPFIFQNTSAIKQAFFAEYFRLKKLTQVWWIKLIVSFGETSKVNISLSAPTKLFLSSSRRLKKPRKNPPFTVFLHLEGRRGHKMGDDDTKLLSLFVCNNVQCRFVWTSKTQKYGSTSERCPSCGKLTIFNKIVSVKKR